MSDKMWHEARRQERKIKGMLVDYRRRAERRRDFYEKIKADPTQFLQVHGRQCKIHLDPAVAAAADSSTAMMPWQGDPDNLIDRFDVRAHLDHIPPVKKDEKNDEVTQEERQLNYERYRIIAQNSFLGLSEEKFLNQLNIEEQFGYTDHKEKKKERLTGIAIGFNYEDSSGTSQPQPIVNTKGDESEHSDSDLDVDLSINVSKMDPAEAHEMNKHGRNYGMRSNDFYSFLIKDLDEAESYRLAKEEEHEKAMYAGRKSRRERRAHREKRLANRVISPPSYAARTSPEYKAFRESKSPSKSPSPDNAGKITYITSFGDEDETLPTKSTYADKVKSGKPKKRKTSPEKSIISRNYKRKRSASRDSRCRSNKNRSRDRYRRRSRSSSSRSRSSSRSHKISRKRVYKRSSSSSSDSSSSSSSAKSRRPTSSSSSTSSSSRSKEKSLSRSKSKSPMKKESPPKQIPRYYGRKKSDQSSSELSDSDQNDNDKNTKEMTDTLKMEHGNNISNSIKKSAGTPLNAANLSIQERLKRKRQALLNRQFKADKIAEMTKAEREKQEQQTREDELREMAIKLRKRQREKRHAYDSDSSDSTHSDTHSRSPRRDNNDKSGSTSPSSSKKDDNDQLKKRQEKEEESKTSYSWSRSPEIYEDKKKLYYEKKYDGNGGNKKYERNKDWRDERDRERDDKDRRYSGDRNDRKGERSRRDDRNRWDDRGDRRYDRDRRDYRYDREFTKKDRYEHYNSDEDSNKNNSRPFKSLVDY